MLQYQEVIDYKSKSLLNNQFSIIYINITNEITN